MPRVLIVDDLPIQIRVAERLLKRGLLDTETFSASCGRTALDVLEVKPIDLVVTDLQMENGDGLELVQLVRSKYPHIPVILMTSHGSEDTAIAALQAGAAAYLPKLRVQEDLVSTVEKVLMHSQSWRQKRRVMKSLEKCEATFVLENDVNLLTPLFEYVGEQIGYTELFDQTDLTRIKVALNESLTNAIYHGNLEVSSDLRQEDESIFHLLVSQRQMIAPYCDRRVFVSTNTSTSQLEIIVRDEGPGFNVKKELDPDKPMDLERIGGRGILLIRSFMDVAYYNALGNELHMIKYPTSARFQQISRAVQPTGHSLPEDRSERDHTRAGAEQLVTC